MHASNGPLTGPLETATNALPTRQIQRPRHTARPGENNLARRQLKADDRSKAGHSLQTPTTAHRSAGNVPGMRPRDIPTELTGRTTLVDARTLNRTHTYLLKTFSEGTGLTAPLTTANAVTATIGHYRTSGNQVEKDRPGQDPGQQKKGTREPKYSRIP